MAFFFKYLKHLFRQLQKRQTPRNRKMQRRQQTETLRIYEYTPGFLHAKCWVSDDVTAVVGSINMDYRSLFLHFECGVLLQKNSQVAVLRDDVRATLPQCREIQVTECRTSLPGTVLDSVLRLLSPLM